MGPGNRSFLGIVTLRGRRGERDVFPPASSGVSKQNASGEMARGWSQKWRDRHRSTPGRNPCKPRFSLCRSVSHSSAVRGRGSLSSMLRSTMLPKRCPRPTGTSHCQLEYQHHTLAIARLRRGETGRRRHRIARRHRQPTNVLLKAQSIDSNMNLKRYRRSVTWGTARAAKTTRG